MKDIDQNISLSCRLTAIMLMIMSIIIQINVSLGLVSKESASYKMIILNIFIILLFMAMPKKVKTDVIPFSLAFILIFVNVFQILNL